MFKINTDLSIEITRGDAVEFTVTAKDNGENYVFQVGDIVRFKVFEKKGCECVVLQKDFAVETAKEEVTIQLTEEDTKIGELINKPKDYWYEVELNPDTYPQTIIGYDEDGAKVFKLYPEGRDLGSDPIAPDDIPYVDKELDMTSHNPVENQAIAKQFAVVNENLLSLKDYIDSNIHRYRGEYKGDIDSRKLNGVYWLTTANCTGTFPSVKHTYAILDATENYQKLIGYTNTGVGRIDERYYINSRWYEWTRTDSVGSLALSGGTMTGRIAMGSNKITDLGTPTEDADAVTLGYANENYASKDMIVGKKLSNMIVKGANQAPYKTYEVLQTYLANRDRLYYDTPGFVGYDYNENTGKFTPQTIMGRYNEKGETMFPIVCATIAMLALQGIGFENCRINTGTVTDVNGVPQLTGGENISYSGCKTIDLTEKEIIDYWDYSKVNGVVTHPHGTVYSANMAKLFYDAGMLHKIKTPEYSEILPGDVLFYDNYEISKPEGQVTVPFLNVGHVEIFVGWDGDNVVSLGTDNGDDAPSMMHSKKSRKGTMVKNYLKYYARIPCAGEPGAVKQIANPMPSNPFEFVKGGNLTITTTEPLKRDRAYPIVLKLLKKPDGTNARFNIFGTTSSGSRELLSQIFVDANKAQNVAPNTYYTTLIIPETFASDVTTLTIYCADNEELNTATVESVSVYNTIVQQG